MLTSKFCVVVNKCPMFNREQIAQHTARIRLFEASVQLTLLQFSLYVVQSNVRSQACMQACRLANSIVPLCSLTKGALRRKYTLNLKMFFLLIREATIICSQYLVSVTLNYDIRAFNVCRLEERELLSACLASCVLSNI